MTHALIRLRALSVRAIATAVIVASTTGCPPTPEPLDSGPSDGPTEAGALDGSDALDAGMPEAGDVLDAGSGAEVLDSGPEPLEQCGFEYGASSNPTRELIVSVCLDPAVRRNDGDFRQGWRDVPVDVLVALKVPSGAPPGTAPAPVRAMADVTSDFAAVNAAFASAQLRFVVASVTSSSTLPLTPMNNAVVGNRAIFPAGRANVVLAYVDQIQSSMVGFVTKGTTDVDNGVAVSAANLATETIAHEFGHFFGLRHTHDCVVDPAHPADQARNGDEVADTPEDPSPNAAFQCDNAPAPSASTQATAGGCTTTRAMPAAACTVSCTGGQTPDPTNLMSYYGGCRTRFSAGQIEVMRCVARHEQQRRVHCQAPTVQCPAVPPPGAPQTCLTLDDRQHCGACETACLPGYACRGGTCVAPAPGRCVCEDGWAPAGVDCGSAQCTNLCTHAGHGLPQCTTTCARQCSGRVCGTDGCGGSCGSCVAGTHCNGAGQCVCSPACAGRSCGPDGCGGTCGACASGQTCLAAGTCCAPNCSGRACGGDGCGGTCGTCATGRICVSGGQCVRDSTCRCANGHVVTGVLCSSAQCQNVCTHSNQGGRGC